MATLGAILVLFLFSLCRNAFGENNDLMQLKGCIPTASQHGSCHTCICFTNGVFHCRSKPCDNHTANSTRRNNQDLPEIRDGEECTPGKNYKMQCNTCYCYEKGNLMCTKILCLDWIPGRPHAYHGKKTLRQLPPNAKYLPKIPSTACEPGQLYRSGCRRCFCDDKRRIMCSNKKNEACVFDKQGNPYPIRTPEDIRSSFSASLREDVPVLDSISEKCEPGKTYRVDCNQCVCMASNDLVCQTNLCISYEDMNRLEAKESSGRVCTPDQENKLSSKCVKCKCVNGLSKCTAESDCIPLTKQKLYGGVPLKEVISEPSDKCVADTIYNTNCNKCYCQEDGSLRCTQKSCLNFSQVKLLQEKRDYLEKHGL